MVSLRNFRMKCFERRPLEEKKAIKVDFFSRLLNDLESELDLTNPEFHALCEILADKCSMNIFQGGDIDNVYLYTSLLKCRYPSKISQKAQDLSISIARLKKESMFPFNISELFFNEAEFRVKIIRKKPKMLITDEVLSVFYEYWPVCKQHYLGDEELEMY